MDVLRKIQGLQKERGYSNKQLSTLSGVPQTTIQGLYDRGNTPTLPTLTGLCNGFGITLAQFFADTNVPPDLTEMQIELLECWNTSPKEKQKAILEFLRNMT